MQLYLKVVEFFYLRNYVVHLLLFLFNHIYVDTVLNLPFLYTHCVNLCTRLLTCKPKYLLKLPIFHFYLSTIFSAILHSNLHIYYKEFYKVYCIFYFFYFHSTLIFYAVYFSILPFYMWVKFLVTYKSCTFCIVYHSALGALSVRYAINV